MRELALITLFVIIVLLLFYLLGNNEYVSKSLESKNSKSIGTKKKVYRDGRSTAEARAKRRHFVKLWVRFLMAVVIIILWYVARILYFHTEGNILRAIFILLVTVLIGIIVGLMLQAGNDPAEKAKRTNDDFGKNIKDFR